MQMSFSIRRFFKNPRLKKAALALAVLVVAAFGTLAIARPAYALDIGEIFCQILGWLVYWVVIWPVSQLLMIAICILVWVCQYNNFIYAPPVSIGWTLVRDICNMFFVVGLLIIAFGTVLRIDKYLYTKLLFKLLVAAVIVNFSKMICGILIDASQVVTLTFVNAFSEIAAGNLTNALGIFELLSMGKELEVTDANLLASIILASLFLIISLIVVISLIAILAMRIVYLWILVVMSPIAFAADAFPQDSVKGLASSWWKEFVGFLVVGPLLAFFLWLTFSVTAHGKLTSKGSFADYAPPCAKKGPQALVYGVTKIGTSDMVFNFIIVIGLLIGGMAMSKKVSGKAGELAGTVHGKVTSGAKSVGKFALRQARRAPARAWRAGAAIGRGARGVFTEEGQKRLGERLATMPQRMMRAGRTRWEERKTKAERVSKYSKRAQTMTAKDLERQATDITSSQEKRLAAQKELMGRGKMTADTAKQTAKDLRGHAKNFAQFKKKIVAEQPELAAEVFYGGLQNEKNTKKFIADIKGEKLENFGGILNSEAGEGVIEALKDNAGMSEKEIGKMAIDNLKKEELSALNDKSDAKGLKLFDNIDENDFIEEKEIIGKDGTKTRKMAYNEEKAKTYVEATGNLHQVDQGHKGFENLARGQLKLGNVSAAALKSSKKVAKLMNQVLTANQIKSITNKDKEVQKAYINTQGKIMDEVASQKSILKAQGFKDTSKEVKEVVKEEQVILKNTLEAGGKIEHILDLKSGAGTEALGKGFGKSVKVEHIVKSDVKDISNQAFAVLAENTSSPDVLKRIGQEDGAMAAKISARGLSDGLIDKSGLGASKQFQKMLSEEKVNLQKIADEIKKQSIDRMASDKGYEDKVDKLLAKEGIQKLTAKSDKFMNDLYMKQAWKAEEGDKVGELDENELDKLIV